MMSTGLACDQLGGSTAFRRASSSSLSGVSGTFSAAAASAAITPAPPPLVSTISPPEGPSRKRASVSAARNRSCSEFTRSMPARAMAASNTASEPASAPVCEAAAACPAAERPALTTITGLLRAAARAADMNFGLSSTLSM